jgi:hypothetical protein
VSSSIVLIGPKDALPALRERFDPRGELRAFAESDALDALDHIVRTKPRIVALEKEFSSSSRGRALVNRINADPSLGGCEVRVLAQDAAPARAASATPTAGSSSAVAVDEPPHVAAAAAKAAPGTLDQHGTRKSARIEVRDGVEVLVDGNPAVLVDITESGCQVHVLSAKTLKPNQRVRVALPEGPSSLRCDGAVVWASFEMPKGQPPRYRVGIELNGADADNVLAYANRHKKA